MSIQIRAARAATGPVLPGYGSVRATPRGMPMGDPGFFGDLWGGIKGGVSGFLTGGPLGALGGAIGGFTGAGETQPTSLPTLPPMSPLGPQVPSLFQDPRSYPQVPTPGTRGAVERFLPGGSTGMMDDPRYRAGKQSRTGYHWNKSDYFLKNGSLVRAGTKEVKNRKMNPLNPSATKASMKRLGRAKTAAKDINRVTIRKKACAHK